MAGDPTSWLLVERGWDVVGPGGEHLGHVEEVAGDESKDIFSGLVVRAGVFKGTRFVPADRVSTIVEGEVRVDADASAFERLDESAPGA